MNILLIEFGESHTELFYSHLKILTSNENKVWIGVNEKIYDRIPKGFNVKEIKFSYLNYFSTFKIIFSLFRIITKNRIDKVIINSAHGNITRDFCIFSKIFYPHVQFIGVAHYASKFSSSVTQKIISWKIKKYFFLNDLLLEVPALKQETKLKFRSFYPIFFPDSKKSINIDKKGKIFISIPGSITFNQRDYLGFIKNIIEKKSVLFKNIHFFLLGNGSTKDGFEFKKIIENEGLSHFFTFFYEFIEVDVFCDYVSQSDLLMNLINPATMQSQEEYLNNKISGAYNIAAGFKIPLFLEESFSQFDDFHQTAFFYNSENVVDILNDLALHPQKIVEKKQSLQEKEKFTFSYQQKNYIDFLNL